MRRSLRAPAWPNTKPARRAVGVAFAALWLAALPARAEVTPLRLMNEPLSYTDVIDALEPGDRFDLNAQITFQRTITESKITREVAGDAGARPARVADAKQVRSELALQFDVGLQRDLMAFVGLPLVLADERSLSRPGGLSAADAATRLSQLSSSTGANAALFDLPFSSPVRAGFDHLTLGGAWAPIAQAHFAHLPTWVILASGERPLGRLLAPCEDTGEGRVCGSMSSADTDGDGLADGTRGGSRNPGMSRGVSAFQLETRVSRRYEHFEPYAGLGARVEWASSGRSRFAPGGDLPGYPSTLPPRQLHATLGGAYIPWEHRGRYQRLAIDLRLMARYFTAGRDYSPLFDALGTSSHPDLARAQPEAIRGDAQAALAARCDGADDTDCSVGKGTSFYGLTDLSPRLRYSARLALEVQAARYVRFNFSGGASWVTPYFLTSADPCGTGRASGKAQGLDAASCTPHASNPAYRAVIDAPGHRFLIRSEWVLDFMASATAQF